ncbi:MAG: glycoside hydrolase family 25 protein [Prevotella sp.]|jgi:lysozyme|nr:glycoside hydrolase family 25 protein [Prevotella sp.]
MKVKAALYFVIVLAMIVFICGGVYVAFTNGYIRLNYPSSKDYPVQGIDVSHHQQKIDWAGLDREKVQFAFIKATEGGDHKDSMFRFNWREARDNKILSGAYHFFTFCKGGKEQARNYIHYVPRDSMDLPPVIDLEYGGNCSPANRKEDLIAEIAGYFEIVEDHYQRKALIYTTNEFYKNYLQNQFPDNPVWIRNIVSKPDLPDGRGWLFWQFSNRGRIDGISTLVDLNVFNGSREKFERLLLKKPG